MASSPTRSAGSDSAHSSQSSTPHPSAPTTPTSLGRQPSSTHTSVHRPSLLSISLARGLASTSASTVPQFKRSISSRSGFAVENDIDAGAILQIHPPSSKGKARETHHEVEPSQSFGNLKIQDTSASTGTGAGNSRDHETFLVEGGNAGVEEDEEHDSYENQQSQNEVDIDEEHDNESVAKPSENDSDPRIMLREQLRRNDSARPATLRIRRESYKSIPPDQEQSRGGSCVVGTFTLNS